MKISITILAIGLALLACKQDVVEVKPKPVKRAYNASLSQQLRKMVSIDQIAAYIPVGPYASYTDEEWAAFKDSVFVNNCTRLEALFKQYGFIGQDIAGHEGSSNFWTMVQHCDHNPEFQEEVLSKMKVEVEANNANRADYAMLVDRVRVNSGRSQVYGTQVSYNLEIAQAYAENLEDPGGVNARRLALRMQALEVYLNEMSKAHYQMNKEVYEAKGVSGPKLYEVEK